MYHVTAAVTMIKNNVRSPLGKPSGCHRKGRGIAWACRMHQGFPPPASFLRNEPLTHLYNVACATCLLFVATRSARRNAPLGRHSCLAPRFSNKAKLCEGITPSSGYGDLLNVGVSRCAPVSVCCGLHCNL